MPRRTAGHVVGQRKGFAHATFGDCCERTSLSRALSFAPRVKGVQCHAQLVRCRLAGQVPEIRHAGDFAWLPWSAGKG